MLCKKRAVRVGGVLEEAIHLVDDFFFSHIVWVSTVFAYRYLEVVGSKKLYPQRRSVAGGISEIHFVVGEHRFAVGGEVTFMHKLRGVYGIVSL